MEGQEESKILHLAPRDQVVQFVQKHILDDQPSQIKEKALEIAKSEGKGWDDHVIRSLLRKIDPRRNKFVSNKAKDEAVEVFGKAYLQLRHEYSEDELSGKVQKRKPQE